VKAAGGVLTAGAVIGRGTFSEGAAALVSLKPRAVKAITSGKLRRVKVSVRVGGEVARSLVRVR
jgi:hypothetical protein